MLLPFFFFPLLEKNISNNLSKLKDKLGPGVYQMFDSGLCRKRYRTRAERRAADEARALTGRRARGGYAPRGSVQPLVDGSLHQEEAGRRAGRWAVGRRDGTRQAPRTSTRGRSRAGPGRSGGGRVCAPAGPSEPVLGKKTALSRESRQSGSAQGGAASGPGPALPTPGASRRPAGLGRRADSGPRAGERAGGPRAAAEAPAVAASTTASPGFCPEARRASGSPTPGVEEGGKGAGKGRSVRGHEPGAAPGRAPPAGRGSRPGPAQGGGARRQGVPCAVVATRKPATRVGRSKGGKTRVGKQASVAPSAPIGASRGPARGPRPGGCLPSPWSSANAAIFQPARVTSGAGGAGAGVGAGWGQGYPTPAGPHVQAGHAGGPHRGNNAAGRCTAGPAQRGFPRAVAVGAGNARWCLSPRSGPA